MKIASPAAEALDQVRTQPTVSLSTAARALGIGVATASRSLADGSFPVPTVRLGTGRVIVPTPALRALLQLDAETA